MTILEAILLGIIQGITEFLPVSSTGHLILIRKLFGQNSYGTLSFDAILQLSTTFAVIFYFRKDLLNICKSILKSVKTKMVDENINLLLTIVIATIPAVVIGLFLEKKMDTTFRDPVFVSIFLIVGSFVMLAAERFHQKIKLFDKNNKTKSLFIGIFQSLALLPGFSRSGATISGGFFSKLSREEAVRFSFLISIPILIGTGFKKLFEIDTVSNKPELLISSIFAFIFGLLSIHFLLKFLKSKKLYIFIVYRILLAFIIFRFIL